jgi:hypothetical protein
MSKIAALGAEEKLITVDERHPVHFMAEALIRMLVSGQLWSLNLGP